MGIEEEAHTATERIPNVQQSVRNSSTLSKVSLTDRTGPQEDTQLDWDRPTEAYL